MELAEQKYALLLSTHPDEKELEAEIAQLFGTQLDSRLLKEITAQIRLAQLNTRGSQT